MPHLKDGWSSKSPLGTICALVFHHTAVFLLLTRCCGGQVRVLSPSQPIVARLGDDIMLPCHLEPAEDASDQTIEWTRPDLNPRFVHVWRDGVELKTKKHPFYVGRTSMSVNKLKHGDISLKLHEVKRSDEGTYRCFVPTLNRESSVELVVGAVSSLIISLMRTENDGDVSGVDLQCESKGWHPEPEVLWLNAEGNLLPAGPAETVRGPDGLYTVSSRVTVEKRHNSLTCKVQQKNVNQTTEINIVVADESFSVAHIIIIIISLAVVFMVILAVVFVVWKRKWKQRSKNVSTETRTSDDMELQPFFKEKEEKETQTLQVIDQRTDTKDLDEKHLREQLNKVEEERNDVLRMVHFFMVHKKDVENQEAIVKQQMQEIKRQKEENNIKEEKQNENEHLATKTNLDTVKEQLEKKHQGTAATSESILRWVAILTEKKEELDNQREQIQKQLEEIEQQRAEIEKD